MEDLDSHIHIETLDTRSTDELKSVFPIKLEPSWMDLILGYLTNGALPKDKFAARKVTRQAPHYILYDGNLYNRSLTFPLLKCLLSSEVDYLLRTVHERICRKHLAGQAIAYKIF